MWRMAFKAGQSDGWAKLADEFEGHGSVDVSRNYMTVNLGWMAYKSCVRVGVSSEGLTLQIQFPFRFGHPDLFIPWGRLELTGRGLLGLSVELDLKRDDLPIKISPGIFGGTAMVNAISQQFAVADGNSGR